MKIKTIDLIGPALDWAVAKIEWPSQISDFGLMYAEGDFHYSTDWTHGGLVIEKTKINLHQYDDPILLWAAFINEPAYVRRGGSTPLIAAMRCYVASKLGDEVDVPKELV